MARAHVVGAGLAGLSSALRLLDRGYEVRLHEAAPEAGGRCRSHLDPALERLVDNGNHLLLSGNGSAMAFLDRVGARDRLSGPPEARLNFVDLASGERWTFRPNRGPVPWWIFSARRRVAGTRARDYLAARRLLGARPGDAVADLLPARGALHERFWEPLTVAALNAPPERAAAILLRRVLVETFAKGAAACRPLIARTGLTDAFVDPALAVLEAGGATVRRGSRLKALEFDGGRVAGLRFASGEARVESGDAVVLAVPHWAAASLLPGVACPEGSDAIVNAHFRLDAPAPGMEEDPVLGVIGGAAQWLFARGDVLSVTISAAAREARLPARDVAAAVWADCARALGLGAAPLPPWRVVKERRATFEQSPLQVAARPGAATPWRNLALAGDWTDTGLPATIEGAIRSGETAAAALEH